LSDGLSAVVLAKAGTHTLCPLDSTRPWVPAFAGTTAKSDSGSQQTAKKRAYGFIPAGATWELVNPIASNARRTAPEAFSSSMKALT